MINKYIKDSYPQYFVEDTTIRYKDMPSHIAYTEKDESITLSSKYLDECLSDDDMRNLFMLLIHEYQHVQDLQLLNYAQKIPYSWDMYFQEQHGFRGLWKNRGKTIEYNAYKAYEESYWDIPKMRKP